MFDTISVSGDLPFSQEMIDLGINKNNSSFQTKDLDCTMSHYIIQNDELFTEKFKTEKWIEGDKNGKSIMDRVGYLDRQDPYFERVNFHGEIYFYEFLTNVQDKWDCWVEFKAIFTDNKLQKIELFEFTKTDNTERKKQDEEWRQEILKKNNIWYNKYIFHTRPFLFVQRRIWFRFWSKISNITYKISYL